MNFDVSDFWNRVRDLIKKHNITQRTLSSNMGLTPRTVETWINQKTVPNAYQTYLLSKELKCPMEYLVTGEKPKQDNSESIALLKQVIENLS